jgi:hypothetical protein
MRQNKVLYNLLVSNNYVPISPANFLDIIYTAIYTGDLLLIENILTYLKSGKLKTFVLTTREIDLMLELGMFNTMVSFKLFIPPRIVSSCFNKYLSRRSSTEDQCTVETGWRNASLLGLEKSLSSGMVKHSYEIYVLLKTCNQLKFAEHEQVLLKYITETRLVRYALGHRPGLRSDACDVKVDESVLSLVIKPYLERSAIRVRRSTGWSLHLNDASRIIDILKVLKKSTLNNCRKTNVINLTIKQLNYAYKTSIRSIRF